VQREARTASSLSRAIADSECLSSCQPAQDVDPLAANKTDANDADGLAHLAEVGFYREVRVKGFDSMLTRTLVAARTKLVHIKTELSNQIRGLMKTFGLVVPAGKGSRFEAHVRELLAARTDLAAIIMPLLDVWLSMRLQVTESAAGWCSPHVAAKPVSY
jgi:transposase